MALVALEAVLGNDVDQTLVGVDAAVAPSRVEVVVAPASGADVPVDALLAKRILAVSRPHTKSLEKLVVGLARGGVDRGRTSHGERVDAEKHAASRRG